MDKATLFNHLQSLTAEPQAPPIGQALGLLNSVDGEGEGGEGPAPTGRRGRKDIAPRKPEDLFDFKDSGGTYTGKYPKSHAIVTMRAALAAGVDPHELLALYTRESNMGTKKGVRNTYMGSLDQLDKPYQEKYYALQKQFPDIDPRALVAAVDLQAHNDRAKSWGRANSDAERLQAYNGYGKLTRSALGGAKKAYGMDVPEEGLDMGKLLLYGKSLAALKKDLMSNKDIQAMLAELKQQH